jgi:hypothetical protein
MRIDRLMQPRNDRAFSLLHGFDPLDCFPNGFRSIRVSGKSGTRLLGLPDWSRKYPAFTQVVFDTPIRGVSSVTRPASFARQIPKHGLKGPLWHFTVRWPD